MLDAVQMQSWANYDILFEIWQHLQAGSTKLQKVKAHALKDDDPPNLDTWHQIGNHVADTVAKKALVHLDKTSPVHSNYAEHCEYLSIVKQQMQFRYEIQLARAKCLQQQDNNNNPQSYRSYHSNLERLFNMKHDGGVTYAFDDSDFAKVQCSLWGTTISYRLLHWLSLLVWPAEPSGDDSTGITWYELAVNFQTVMQCGLLVNIGTTGNKFLPKQLELHSREFLYSKQVAAFERAITTISTLLRKDVLPKRRQLSSSLRLLGASHGKQGLVDRPQLPRQQQTLETIKRHFEAHHGSTPDMSPEIPLMPADKVFEEHITDIRDRKDWKARISKYNSARKRR